MDRSHGNAASPCFIDTPLKPFSLVSSCFISILYPMSMKTFSLHGQIPAKGSDIDSAEPVGRGGSPTNSIPSSTYLQNAHLPGPWSNATCCSLLEMTIITRYLNFGPTDNAKFLMWISAFIPCVPVSKRQLARKSRPPNWNKLKLELKNLFPPFPSLHF